MWQNFYWFSLGRYQNVRPSISHFSKESVLFSVPPLQTSFASICPCVYTLRFLSNLMTSAMLICLKAKLSMMWLTASAHRSFVNPFAIIRSRSKRKKSLDCEGNAVVNFLITTTLSSAVIGESLYLDISQYSSFSLIIRVFACIEERKATCDCFEDFCI